jgi:hypothetical protein
MRSEWIVRARRRGLIARGEQREAGVGEAQISGVDKSSRQKEGRKEEEGGVGLAGIGGRTGCRGRTSTEDRREKKTPWARNPSCAWSRGRDIATVAPALRKHLQSGRVPSTLRRFSASERPLSPNPSGCHTFFSTSFLLLFDRLGAFRAPRERAKVCASALLCPCLRSSRLPF